MRMSFANRQENRSDAQTWVGSATLSQITSADDCKTAPQIAPLLPPNQQDHFTRVTPSLLFSRTIVC
jgi:hypothetical protein